MQERLSYIFPDNCPQRYVYDGMEKDVNTVGVNNVLITHKDVSDDVAYAMTKSIV